MPTIIFGLLVLVLALWVLGVISRVDPKIAARVLKAAGGILAIGFAAFLRLARRNLCRRSTRPIRARAARLDPVWNDGFYPAHAEKRGQTSRVRSAYLEMELDHDSGAMRGRIIAGRRGGATLEALDVRRWPAYWRSLTRKAARY